LKYLDSIQNNPKALMAHIYVRHMGDLFGGQALAKLLPGPNNMFKFEDIPSLIKRVREKLDVSMAEEANLAFDFNIAMIKEYND
jgi:heme oxygenase